MKVVFQVFGLTFAVVLAVFLGNVAYTKYQLYEARGVFNDMFGTAGMKSASAPVPAQVADVHNYRNIIDHLSKENEKLRRELNSLKKQLTAYKSTQTAEQRAFSEFYSEPADCLVFRSDAHMVECQNAKIIAKRDFKRLWDAGQRNF